MDSADTNYVDLYATCLRHSASHPACDQLFTCLRPLFERVVGRLARQFNAQSEVDDILQEVSLKLVLNGNSVLPLLPKESDAAAAYFSVIAVNTARDYFRMRHSVKRDARATVSIHDSLNWLGADTGQLSETELDLLFLEIEKNLKSEPRECRVFRLYYRQGYTAREIAAIPVLNLTTKGVESLLHRIATQLRQKMQGAVPGKQKGVEQGVRKHR